MTDTVLMSETKRVVISDRGPMILIGERINATGRPRLSAALRDGDMGLVREEALAQVQAGADILDVNAGVSGHDETVLLPAAVRAVMEVTDVPLSLDSANPGALEAALKVYRGKPLINSVTGDERSLGAVLPLAKKYGAGVIGLAMDEEGVPHEVEKRVVIAGKIVERAQALGIPPADVVIDCLIQSVAVEPKAALTALETIRRLRAEHPVNITLGASNCSFGLPDRSLVNSAFLAMAVAAGATCAIVDVARVRSIVLAADLLLGHDRYARRYTQAYRQRRQG